MRMPQRRGVIRYLFGLVIAVLAQAGILASVPGTYQSADFAYLAAICHSEEPGGSGDSQKPIKPPVCPVCPACVAAQDFVPSLIPAEIVVPPPAVELVIRPELPPPSTAPPVRMARPFQSRAPPSLS